MEKWVGIGEIAYTRAICLILKQLTMESDIILAWFQRREWQLLRCQIGVIWLLFVSYQ